jgi:hypothetical protein
MVTDKTIIVLSKEGIDFIKGQKYIYTNVAYKIGRDGDTIKRWVRENSERLTLPTVVKAIKDLTGEDITRFFIEKTIPASIK